jgi:hypothetical protein
MLKAGRGRAASARPDRGRREAAWIGMFEVGLPCAPGLGQPPQILHRCLLFDELGIRAPTQRLFSH